MREWGKRKTETRGEKALRFLKSIWKRLLVFLDETVLGTMLSILGNLLSCLFYLLAAVLLIILLFVGARFLIGAFVGSFELSLEEKKELYEAISSHRSDTELRVCEEKLAETHGKITFGDFLEYNDCISEIEKRRKDEEAQRKLDSLGIWKRGQDNE